MGTDSGYGDPKPKPKVKVSAKRVKNETIRNAVVSKKKTATGKDFVSTRGFKIKARAGDKTVTNKKGEKVVVRAKGGNRVVTKKSGTVVRRKANGDRVISKKPATKTTPNRPYVSAQKKYDPASTMATTGSDRSGGNYTGGSSEYTNRRRGGK